jgi:FkbH-like protein
MERKKAEDVFVGPKEEFLASLKMTLTIFPAREGDLQRAEELTVRTHQLNATGYTYSYEELKNFVASDKFILWMAQLDDRYGPYGHIGLTLIECQDGQWTIKLLLMSCRVMTRGVGAALLSHIMQKAKEKNVRLLAEFLPTDRNRMMNIAYRLAGFSEVAKEGKVEILERCLEHIPGFPDYLKVVIN